MIPRVEAGCKKGVAQSHVQQRACSRSEGGWLLIPNVLPEAIKVELRHTLKVRVYYIKHDITRGKAREDYTPTRIGSKPQYCVLLEGP